MNEAVDSKLIEWGVMYKATYLGVVPSPWHDDTKSNVDMYQITLKLRGGLITTPYYMGLGNRKDGKRLAPTAASVLYGLLSDASAMDESFSDWADNFGYDSDSIKTFNIYNACCAIGKQLKNVFTGEHLETLRELLQDY